LSRAPYQVLVMPFRRSAGSWEFAALRRADDGSWQGVAGGGEGGEIPAEAALREVKEELGLAGLPQIVRLDSMASVPVACFAARHEWDPGLYVIPEHCFAVDCTDLPVTLSPGHSAITWAPFETVSALLRWDSNRTALWELRERLAR